MHNSKYVLYPPPARSSIKYEFSQSQSGAIAYIRDLLSMYDFPPYFIVGVIIELFIALISISVSSTVLVPFGIP